MAARINFHDGIGPKSILSKIDHSQTNACGMNREMAAHNRNQYAASLALFCFADPGDHETMKSVQGAHQPRAVCKGMWPERAYGSMLLLRDKTLRRERWT